MKTQRISDELLNKFAIAIESLNSVKSKSSQNLNNNYRNTQTPTSQYTQNQEFTISELPLVTQTSFQDNHINHRIDSNQAILDATNITKGKLNQSNQQSLINSQTQDDKNMADSTGPYNTNFELIIPMFDMQKSSHNTTKSAKSSSKIKTLLKSQLQKHVQDKQQASPLVNQIKHQVKQSQKPISKLKSLSDNRRKAKKGSKKQIEARNLIQQRIEIVVKDDIQIKQKLQNKRLIYHVKKTDESQINGAQINKYQRTTQNKQHLQSNLQLQKSQFHIIIPLLPYLQIPSPKQQSANKKKIKPQSKKLSKNNTQKKSQNFQGFLKQRSKDTDQIMNIGIASLLDIVQQLAKNNIIAEDQYNKFASNHTIYDIRQFLQKFKAGILHKFDFDSIKFTLLDHRRLSELLLRLFPNKYTFTVPFAIDSNINDFLVSMYDLPAEDYFNLYTKIDKISKIKWWSQIMAQQKSLLLRKIQEQKNNKQKIQQNTDDLQSKNTKRSLRQVYSSQEFSKTSFNDLHKNKKNNPTESNKKNQLIHRIPQSIIEIRQKLNTL